MKIITKVVANRLKHTLPDVIDLEQSAFVQGRLITDNALIAMECFHWLKKKKKGKNGVMALKLDMSKAYDRIKWIFVEKVLSAMGYPSRMVEFIMRCVSSVSYQILINGQPSRSFTPERGLRQGEPLSPYLFILCADVFSGPIHKDVATKELNGTKVARQTPQISHLFFADDSLLFSRANTTEARKILNILATYQQASGQVVNLDKSEASFSRNVSNEDKNMICEMMGVKAVEAQSRYLGFPVPFGRSKKVIFSFVIDRVWKKLKGWKEKCLSKAGKVTLIKAIAQAIPNYILSCYIMPEVCCKEIDSMLAKFWWGSREESKKFHWLSWERLSKAKSKGGMGFRGFKEFNKAKLGKHCWRLINGESSLLEDVLRSRYYLRGNFLNANVGYQPSYAWRSIISARDTVDLGGKWIIGNGEKVKIWEGKWLADFTKIRSRNDECALAQDAVVKDLIDPNTVQWNRELICCSVGPAEARKIDSIPLSIRHPDDNLVWHWEKDGNYSLRSAYHVLCDDKSRQLPGPSSSMDDKVWKEIWRAPIPNKIKNFLSRLARDILPTRANLYKKGINLDMAYPLCNQAVETSSHLFMQCNFVRLILFASQLGSHIPEAVELNCWILNWLTCKDMLGTQLFCTLLWKLWFARNQCVFKCIVADPVSLANNAMCYVQDYISANPRRQQQSSPQASVNVETQLNSMFSMFVDAGCFVNGHTGWGLILKTKRELLFSVLAGEKTFMWNLSWLKPWEFGGVYRLQLTKDFQVLQ